MESQSEKDLFRETDSPKSGKGILSSPSIPMKEAFLGVDSGCLGRHHHLFKAVLMRALKSGRSGDTLLGLESIPTRWLWLYDQGSFSYNRKTDINNYFKCKQIKHTNQKYRLIEWIQKQDPFIYCLQETHFRHRDTYSLKVKEWKRLFHVNRNQKKARVAILISDNIDFKE